MYIQKIKISNFKSIYDTLELDFNNIKGFWKISGAVGAGKTSIGEAIIFGLFGSVNGKNNSDLISWGQKHGLVELWCISKGNSLYIRRELNMYGQSPIYAEVNGDELLFTNKREAQSQLENDYYDTSRTMVELLCIISFNNFKSIATMNTKDTKMFLDKVLGFQILTQYSDICKSLKIENYSKIISAQQDINRISSQIQKLREISDIERIDGSIDDVRSTIRSLEDTIKTCKQDIKKITDEFNKKTIEKNSELSSIVVLGKNKAKEIKLIESGTCPTCGAEIDQSKLDIKKQEKEILTQSYLSKQKEIEELKSTYTEQVDPINNDLKKTDQELRDQRTLLVRLEEQVKRLSINTNEIKNLEKTCKDFENIYNTLSAEDQDWQQLYNYLSTNIRQQILNSFIPMLNKNILEYSQQLQQPYIMHFDNDFKCTINMNGLDDRSIPISSLSTGQLKTVDMIIILSVLKSVISSSNINIMFLDELFSNLDSDLRAKMCNVLKISTNPQNTLFIISHQDISDEYFDGTISISLEGFGDKFQKKSKIVIS